MRWTIGETARLSGVSVRTLHHYDFLGLLRPSARTEAGYRLYDESDLARLRQILFYRELEFPLADIAGLLGGDADPAEHLGRQRDLLNTRIERLRELAAAVGRELEARTMGVSLTAEERFEVFGEARPEQHAEEVRSRWGETDAYRESTRRTAEYRKGDWIAVKTETEAIESRFVALMTASEAPDSPRGMETAEAHRQAISRWFYECDRAMHRNLAEMYIADPRFSAHYDAIAPGLARYVHDAIVANAHRVDA